MFLAFQSLSSFFVTPAGFSRQIGLLNEGGSVKLQQIDFTSAFVVSFFTALFILETTTLILEETLCLRTNLSAP
jgi:hypothetical protein